MKIDCHIHMVLDGLDWKRAIDGHRNGPDRALIRERLKAYAEAGFGYLRDGGDKWGVGAAAREEAGEWGIVYRTPLAPLICAGHYGGFIGESTKISGNMPIWSENAGSRGRILSKS